MYNFIETFADMIFFRLVSKGKTCHVVMDLPWYWLDLNDFSWDDLTVDYTHFWKNTEQSSGDTFIDDSKVGQLSNIAQCV